MFESFVNSERCKTKNEVTRIVKTFESFVNSERCKTPPSIYPFLAVFESFVNSERCKTNEEDAVYSSGLRALLIQKDAKRDGYIKFENDV